VAFQGIDVVDVDVQGRPYRATASDARFNARQNGRVVCSSNGQSPSMLCYRRSLISGQAQCGAQRYRTPRWPAVNDGLPRSLPRAEQR
jgi:hypothetical protein